MPRANTESGFGQYLCPFPLSPLFAPAAVRARRPGVGCEGVSGIRTGQGGSVLSGEGLLVSVVPGSSVGTSGDPVHGGLGLWAWYWCGVSGSHEGLWSGRSLQVLCAYTPAESCRGTGGLSLRLCYHFPRTVNAQSHTHPRPAHARKQPTTHTHAPNATHTQTHSAYRAHIRTLYTKLPHLHSCGFTHTGRSHKPTR